MDSFFGQKKKRDESGYSWSYPRRRRVYWKLAALSACLALFYIFYCSPSSDSESEIEEEWNEAAIKDGPEALLASGKLVPGLCDISVKDNLLLKRPEYEGGTSCWKELRAYHAQRWRLSTKGHGLLRRYYSTKAVPRCFPQSFLLCSDHSGQLSLAQALGDTYNSLSEEYIHEPHFFKRTSGQAFCAIDEYLDSVMSKQDSSTVIDTSTQMLWKSRVREYQLFPRRMEQKFIKHFVQKPKFILLLRNPIARAYCEYFHNRGEEGSAQEFHLEIVEAITSIGRCMKEGLPRLHCTLKFDTPHFSLARGLYSELLLDWLEAFPSSQMHLVLTDDFVADPSSSLRKIKEFLGKGSGAFGMLSSVEEAKLPSWTPLEPMLHATRHNLREFYKESSAQIGKIFDVDTPTLWNYRFSHYQ